MVNGSRIVRLLRRADKLLPSGQMATLVVSPNDWRVDLSSLDVCTDGGYPGIGVGQKHDCRYGTDGAEGLHGQVFSHGSGERIEFHLDENDACRAPVGHLLADTRALVGAGLGGLGGGIVALILLAFGRWKTALVVLAAGVAIGGAIGAFMPKRERRRFSLSELLAFVGEPEPEPPSPFFRRRRRFA